MKLKVRGFLIFVLIVAFLGCLPVSAADAAVEPVVEIVSGKNEVSITVSASFDKSFESENSGSELYLFALRPYQSTSNIDEYSSELSVKVAKDISVSVPMDDARELLYSKFLFALKSTSGEYKIVTSAIYPKNPEVLSALKYDYPKKLSKKGLQVQMMADAQQLGVAHTTVNVEIGEFIVGTVKPSGGTSVVSWTIGNKTVYFNTAKVEALDKRVKEYTDAGINVFLQIINTPFNSEKMVQEVNCLYYMESNAEASMFAFNTKTRDSVLYIRALFELLADRYTREDRMYGFAGSFIVGFDVNSNRIYNSAGPMSLLNYMYNYTSLLRIADTAMRSKYANGRVYVPVSNKWTEKDGDDPELDYSAHSFITTLNKVIKQGGDIPWNISLSAYASAISGISAIWNDPEATTSIGTPYITMKNIEVACDFMNGSDLKSGEKSRDIIIGEFGISADPGSENELANQAASYAYAYYKAEANDQISAMIYHRHIDSSAETDMFFGLWTNRDTATVLPLSTKPIYDVFKKIDVTPTSEITSSVLGMIGADLWTPVVPGESDEARINPRQIITGTAMDEKDIPDKKFDLKYSIKSKGELSGFEKAENATDIYSLAAVKDEAAEVLTLLDKALPKKDEPYADILEAVLDNSSYLDYMGISKTLDEDLFKGAKSGYLRVTGKAELAGADEGEMINVMVRLTYTIPKDTVNPAKETMNRSDGQEIVYEGTAQVSVDDWHNLTFDISKFLEMTGGKTDSMKIWILPGESETSEVRACALMVAGVSILAIKGMPVILSVLLVILIVLVSVIALIAVVLGVMIVRNKIIREKKRKAYAARKAAMANSQRRTPAQGSQRSGQMGQSRRPNQQNRNSAYPPQGSAQRNPQRQNRSGGSNSANRSQQNNSQGRRPPDNQR